MIRLGFPVRVVGKPGLRSHDSRRLSARHLSISLAYLHDILTYLSSIGVHFYRIASALFAPGLDRQETAIQQLHECAEQLEVLAQQVSEQQVRLTMHMAHTVAPGTPHEETARSSLAAVEVGAALLERLGMGPEGVLVVHVGGKPPDALERFAARYEQLSPGARARLVVEHDTTGCSLGQVLSLHQHCGIPIVFDTLHHQLYNPEELPFDLALGLALASWPTGMRPKVHLSSARSEAHILPARGGEQSRVLPPRPGQHADFVASGDVLMLLQAARGLPRFDLMIEAKAGDLALLRVRSDIARLAPHLASLLA